MATLATVLGHVDTALDTLIGGRLTSDRRNDLQALAAGTTRYQLRADHLTKDYGTSSNEAWEVATLTVEVHHELSGAELAYAEGAMHTDQKSLMDITYWRAITGVYDVTEGPTLQSEAERVGNTISYSMAVELSFTGS